MTTFAATLADRLAHDPGQPLITFYDEATGERVELSVTTYANWVAKTASLLVEEL
ncbi:MAG: TIGR03089 family protein, partial [Alphaproteobacteria bacterium]